MAECHFCGGPTSDPKEPCRTCLRVAMREREFDSDATGQDREAFEEE